MAGLFGGKAKTPAPPRPVRQPVETDPEVLAAARRTRESATRRSGFMSTLLTDQNAGDALIGSSGERLGA
jgi:hypothetical protein